MNDSFYSRNLVWNQINLKLPNNQPVKMIKLKVVMTHSK